MNDDVTYCLFLLFSVASGFFIRWLPSSSWRKTVCLVIGFCSSLFFCKFDFIYGLFSSIVCAILCKLNFFVLRNYRRSILFIVAFTFLTFFRVAHYCGFSLPCPLANAAQLVLTLKIVGIGGEISDSQQREKKRKQDDDIPNIVESEHSLDDPKAQFALQCLYRDIKPSFFDIICYLYSYAGLFTGPYYTYRTWNDAMEDFYSTRKGNICSLPAYCYKTIVYLLSQTALCGLLYFVIVYLFPLEYLWSRDWSASSVLYRLLYIVPVFTWYRMRFYSAWLASEVALASLHIGVYPSVSHPEPGAGPTDLVALHRAINSDSQNSTPQKSCFCSSDCSFWSTETVHNIAIYECEFSPTVAGKLRAWNRTVQYWLAVNTYQRLPRSLPRPVRAFATVFVSAYWHGLHAGYYLGFGTAAALLSAERIFPRLVALAGLKRKSPPQPTENEPGLLGKVRMWAWNYLAGFWSMRAFEYMAVGFYALTFADTTRIWQDMLYIHHVLAVFLLLLSFILPRETSTITKE